MVEVAELDAKSAEDDAGGTDNNLSLQEALLIATIRNYDLLMALLREHNADAAQMLHEVHANGGFVSSQPFIDPEYLANLQEQLAKD